MSQEFKNLISYLDKFRSRYFHALSAFFVYKTLNELITLDVVSVKDARDNVKVMKKFINFFIPSKEALRIYFLLELAKMFDTSDKSLHITKIVNYTQRHIEKLTVDDFKKFNQNRDFLEELIENYRGISQEDIKKIRKELEKNKNVLWRLKTYRNKYLAHDDINKKEIIIKDSEIIDLFRILEEIMNLISSKLNNSTSIWSQVEDNCKESTKMIFDHLKKFDSHKLKERKKLIKSIKLTHKIKK